MEKKYDILEFGKELYIILNVVNYNNNKYLYLINNDDYKNDTSIVKAVENDGVIEYIHIDDDKEFDHVVSLLLENSKDLLDMVVQNS